MFNGIFGATALFVRGWPLNSAGDEIAESRSAQSADDERMWTGIPALLKRRIVGNRSMEPEMARDQKIGLALGILLVGAVAAFFYRHESPTSVPLPELRTAAELDQQIAEKPLAPYLEARPANPESQGSEATAVPLTDQESQGLVPEPIALEGTTSPESATKLASSTAIKPLSPAESVAQANVTRHVVARGDTLSSIASRYLGSAARFQEIYDANRDRLRDANDLRIGQELRIPARMKSTTETIEPGTSSPTSNLDSNADFTPARFLPYPGPRAASKVTGPAGGSGGRRLSQVPPDDQVIRR